jgi:flagellar basal body-associated protein FliL
MVVRKRRSSRDISNTTVVVMLIIVIVVSVVCLGVYMTFLDKAEPEVSSGTRGTVSLHVIEPPVKQEPVEVGGTVGVTVEKPN